MAKLFNEVFSAFWEFFDVTAGELYEAFPGDRGSPETIRAWRTRGAPCRANLDNLVLAFTECISAKREIEYRLNRIRELNDEVAGIWKKYSEEAAPQWCKNRSAQANIAEFFRKAYYLTKSGGEKKEENPLRVVAFDFDGTLIKGLRYSWTTLWKAIGGTGKEATRLKEAFELGHITYDDWLEADCKELKDGGLTLEMVQKAVAESGCTLTKNLVPAIKKLREHNCKIAVISGSVDSVLYSLIPNADELFDVIYINRFVYNKKTGVLDHIIPTKYDWDKYGSGVEGKQAALEKLCERYGAKLKDSVFVGDDYNDFAAMEIAGMKIYYYSYSEKDPARGVGKRTNIRKFPCDAIIEQKDDLMRVANRIIAWDFSDGHGL